MMSLVWIQGTDWIAGNINRFCSVLLTDLPSSVILSNRFCLILTKLIVEGVDERSKRSEKIDRKSNKIQEKIGAP